MTPQIIETLKRITRSDDFGTGPWLAWDVKYDKQVMLSYIPGRGLYNAEDGSYPALGSLDYSIFGEWVTNNANHNDPESWLTKEDRQLLGKHMQGPPRETETYSVTQLEDMGNFGYYKKRD